MLTLLQGPANPTRTIYDTICHGQSLTLYGYPYPNTANVTIRVPATGGGCDSIITLHIKGPIYSAINVYGCLGQPYHYHGQYYIAPGEYMLDTLQAVNGCDSFIYLDLQTPSRTQYIYKCSGLPITYYGHTYTTGGYYTDTIFGPCDTLLSVLVIDRLPFSYLSYGSSCGDSVLVNGHYYHSPGYYIDTIPFSALGCDSLVYLQLYQSPPQSYTSYSGCQGQTFVHNNHIDTIPGIYTDTLTSVSGCDSFAVYNLYVGPPRSYVSISGCAGQTFTHHGRTDTIPGIYMDTILRASTCDSVVQYVTTVIATGHSDLDVDICPGQYYSYNGQRYPPGVYTVSLPLPSRCDSLVYLHVGTAPSFSFFHPIVCAGQTYIYDGHAYTSPIYFYDTLTAVGGCDSIVAVELDDYGAQVDALGFCGQYYSYCGQQYRIPGLYPVTFTAANGCDSIVLVYLTADSSTPSYYDTIQLSTCDTALVTVFNGIIYGFYSSGVYPLTISSCDTMYYAGVTLGAAPPGIRYIVDSFCENAPYQYEGQTFTAPGHYTFTITGGGCDTSVDLTLSYVMGIPVIYVSGGMLYTDSIPGWSYQWRYQGQPVAGATAAHFQLRYAGVYDVVATRSADPGCSFISAARHYTINSISDVADADDISVYPVPNSGTFIIESSDYVGGEVRIYDVLGRVVYESRMASAKESITFERADGTYSISLSKEGRSARRALVIAR